MTYLTGWLHRRLYAAPIHVPCVQFCNGRRKAAKNVAKLDTRHTNKWPRKDVLYLTASFAMGDVVVDGGRYTPYPYASPSPFPDRC